MKKECSAQPGIDNFCDKYIEIDMPHFFCYRGEDLCNAFFVPDGREEYFFLRNKAGNETYNKLIKSDLWKIPEKYDSIVGIRMEYGYEIKDAGDIFELIKADYDKDGGININRIALAAEEKCEKKPLHPLAFDMLTLMLQEKGRIKVSELAETYKYSVRHINNIFRDSYMLSPKDFGRIIRFQNAVAQMMDNPQRNNSEFMENLSYSDQAHFQREFLAYTGMTPGKFTKFLKRKMMTKSDQ